MNSWPALIQLYAPIAGLLAVVFWLGVLSNRVAQLERDRDALREHLDESVKELRGALEKNGEERDTVIRMSEQLNTIKDRIESLDRGLQHANRLIANAFSGSGAKIIELGATERGF